MLSATAQLDAHAEYGRSDGQGQFVTVWGTGCYVSHVYDYFDGRGTDGREPGWQLFFTLAPQEMGRTAGARGAFVAPVSREYTYADKVDTVGTVVPAGGRGPKGFGDTIGAFSKRPYDLENCGGPIQKLSWQDAVIDNTGIATVLKHLNRFESDPANKVMTNRLQQIAQGNLQPTDWDKRYYTHEIREYERYQQLKVPDGIDPGYEIWNDTHTATLEDYQLSDSDEASNSLLYHPDAFN